jgi:hypothetical protein
MVARIFAHMRQNPIMKLNGAGRYLMPFLFSGIVTLGPGPGPRITSRTHAKSTCHGAPCSYRHGA